MCVHYVCRRVEEERELREICGCGWMVISLSLFHSLTHSLTLSPLSLFLYFSILHCTCIYLSLSPIALIFSNSQFDVS